MQRPASGPLSQIFPPTVSPCSGGSSNCSLWSMLRLQDRHLHLHTPSHHHKPGCCAQHPLCKLLQQDCQYRQSLSAMLYNVISHTCRPLLQGMLNHCSATTHPAFKLPRILAFCTLSFIHVMTYLFPWSAVQCLPSAMHHTLTILL